MFRRTVSEADLARLKREREEADRRYNEALTALDAAIQREAELPPPPPPFDANQVDPINARWRIMPDTPPAGSGWRGRLTGFVWRIVAPIFDRQQGFNSALVDHLNRNVAGHREARAALASTIEVLREQLAGLVRFETRLILYLQQITPYVDTKDREVAGLMRRINEDVAEMNDILDHRTVGLAAGLSGVGDELQKRWESMVAREQRFDAKVSGVATAHERAVHELRTSLAAVQQGMLVLKREVERLTGFGPAAAAGHPEAPVPPSLESRIPHPTSRLDSYKYLGFEDRFRGAQDEIRARVAEYLPIFEGASDVLDAGCGRGEFLDLLRERGIAARGVDLNHEMVEVCRARGLEVVEADALGYLETMPDQSLGGVFAAQVVEHLEPAYLLRLLDVAYHKLRPGSAIVLETVNPACWLAFFESYIRDLTHVRPIHPDTLSYLLVASGFQQIETRYRAPVPDAAKLQPITLLPEVARTDGRLADLVETFNANVDRLNALLFTHLDYAAIGRRM